MNNQLEVADWFALQQGLNYTDAAVGKSMGKQIAATAVADVDAAISLVGVHDLGFSLL